MSSSSLSLLQEYYSSSDSDSESIHINTNTNPDKCNTNLSCTLNIQIPTQNTINKLPVPKFLSNKRSIDDVYNDDPEQHSGRVRNFPHKRGNWSSYVFIPCDNYTKKIIHVSEVLSEYFSHIGEFHLVDDFHISLSRTIVLKYHWINEFVGSLKRSLSNCSRFEIGFESVNVYCNDERNRTFVGLKVNSSFDAELKYLIEKVDKVLEDYNLTPFYKDPSFHASILWCLGDKKSEIEKLISAINLHDLDLDFEISVNSAILKTGNKHYSCELI